MLIPLKVLAVIQLFISVSSVVCGCLTLYYGWPNRSGPITNSGPIWGGMLLLISGIFGLVGSCYEDKSFSSKFRTLFMCHHICNVASIGGSISGIVNSGMIIHGCHFKQPVNAYCWPNVKENYMIAIVTVVVVSICVIVEITALINYIMWACSGQKKSKEADINLQ